ncbi:hypothetical protein LPJ77_001049 [Coemansia sp. RSA 2523]|nr:hypothetical protein LPJ58_002594 [Coemansia sp. RSA 1591]KAJ1763361.1 hypothetical protein LPJ69_002533 [Coemansia sp. RSA 1752]KAJ1789482.1 hypothetical protein LPJ67_002479 [Coemansia sp. RSA 1938]KAJ1810236.1 hypothetical protein LPJ77_001049 [Coemansia sp. RSA 2523]KAJ2137419.1 hypothetical protein GGH17_001570 [Coemansia sp. RSA 788]KAJ2149035.1 hypothetical protein IW142_000404 [Coemansia sp. RSA 564]KAJ2152708.1 hypothetical protein GGH16_006056 [Coemansia sp. RSA 560]KAJ2169333.1
MTTPHPADAVAKTGRDMETLFDGFFSSIEAIRQNKAAAEHRDVNATIGSISSSLWTPHVETHEDEDCIRIHAHLPDVPNNQIRIDTDTPGRLKIYCECNTQAAYDSGNDRISERQLGQFEKDIPLPPAACISQMTTIYEGSHVVITIPTAF